jgi:hypothetical protein
VIGEINVDVARAASGQLPRLNGVSHRAGRPAGILEPGTACAIPTGKSLGFSLAPTAQFERQFCARREYAKAARANFLPLICAIGTC